MSEQARKKEVAADLAHFGFKRCSTCRRVKELANFYRKRDKPYSQCKVCHLEVCKPWRPRNREKARKIQRTARARWDAKNSNPPGLYGGRPAVFPRWREISILRQWGLTLHDIAFLLQCNRRTVSKYARGLT